MNAWARKWAPSCAPLPVRPLDKDVLFAYLREHLSPQKTPRYWYQVAEYPLTGSGKIQKFALRDAWKRGDCTELRSDRA
jgi:fatty-acyl-CoA synthase